MSVMARPLIQPTRWCLKCYYVLDGLATHRCPECGQAFDPFDPKSYSRHPTKPQWEVICQVLSAIWVILPAVWMLTYLGALSAFMLFILVPALISSLALRRWRRATAYCILSPFFVFFLHGVIDYVRCGPVRYDAMEEGVSALASMTHPDWPHWWDHGCITEGNEWVHNDPYELGTACMYALVGCDDRSYHGPIPSDDQASKLAAEAKAISLEALLADRVELGDRVIRLDKDVGVRLVRNCQTLQLVIRDDWLDFIRKEKVSVRAALFEGRCLILYVPMIRSRMADGTPSVSIALIDVDCGRPFGFYGARNMWPWHPPVPWIESAEPRGQP